MFRNVLYNEKRKTKENSGRIIADSIRREDWNRCGGMPNMHGRNGVLDQLFCVWFGAAAGPVEECTARVVTFQIAAAIRRDHVSSRARGILPEHAWTHQTSQQTELTPMRPNPSGWQGWDARRPGEPESVHSRQPKSVAKLSRAKPAS